MTFQYLNSINNFIFSENLEIVRELGDRALQGRVCGSIGNTHYLLGNCTDAVKFHTDVRRKNYV